MQTTQSNTDNDKKERRKEGETMDNETRLKRRSALNKFFKEKPEFRHEYDTNEQFREIINIITFLHEEQLHRIERICEKRLNKEC